jgi:YVTN family beta-propeller protein
MRSRFFRAVSAASLSAVFAAGAAGPAAASSGYGVSGGGPGPALLPTGQYLTATAAPGSSYQRLETDLRPDGNADADDAVSTALSPDGKTLLVLTTGFNTSINYVNGSPILFPVLSPLTGLPSEFTNPYTGQPAKGYNQAEWVFVYDVSTGVAKRIQRIPIPDTFEGLAWDPSGARFFVSGGIDDRVLIFKNTGTTTASYTPDAPFVILNHNSKDTLPIPSYDGGLLAGTPAGKAVPALVTGAIAGGLDVSKDGKTLVVANFGNASASIVDLTQATRPVTNEVVFYRPGGLIPTGEYPYAVAVVSNPVTGAYAKAYVTSQRDDQVMVITGSTLTKTIPMPSGPNKMALSADQSVLYVACGNDDSVTAINTATDAIEYKISLTRPGYSFKGANPDDVAVGPRGQTLYVTLGGENAVAVIDVASRSVIGRIPVGWYPTSTRPSLDGKHLFVINEKSNAGPNPGQTYYSWNTPYGISLNKTARNTYTWEAEKAGLVSMPTPDRGTLAHLTRQVDINDNFGVPNDSAEMAFLRKKIQHVIYIVNENRTFDQVFGDLDNGANGDPRLAFFNQPITPNLHKLEKDYATLDNFYDASETSGVGWNWVMQGHTNAYVEETQPVDYGNSNGFGFTYDWQGIVKHINLGLPPTGGNSIFNTRITGILDPTGSSTILPGPRDPSASEGALQLAPGVIGGYIWEDALRAGLTVRNYGWNCDLTYYGTNTPFNPLPVRHPYENHVPQETGSTPTIRPLTDPYYRAFDESYPDIYRIEEWQREFAQYVASGKMPNLMVMTIPHDHTGSFSTALAGLNTPQLELADHDYAIGELVETLSHSKFWGSTAIVMLEDDPQDGQDHVEAHRSIIHIISPWTRSHALVHTTYETPNALRTVEALLGLPPLGENDANAAPMSDVFGVNANMQTYTAIVPGSLCAPPVDPKLVPACSNGSVPKTRRVAQLHDGAWWAAHTTGMDFTKPDHIDSRYYNALLEYGILGRGPLPKRSTVAVAASDDD